MLCRKINCFPQKKSLVENVTFICEFCIWGYGLRCHRIIRAVADVLGIEDMRCKITGSTTPISVVRAVFQGLLSQVWTIIFFVVYVWLILCHHTCSGKSPLLLKYHVFSWRRRMISSRSAKVFTWSNFDRKTACDRLWLLLRARTPRRKRRNIEHLRTKITTLMKFSTLTKALIDPGEWSCDVLNTLENLLQ